MKRTVLSIVSIIGITCLAVYVLVTSSSEYKYDKAMKAAEANLMQVKHECYDLREQAESIIDDMSNDMPEVWNLALVNKFVELYPQSRSEINSSTDLARMTGNWSTLKEILQDWIDLYELEQIRNCY